MATYKAEFLSHHYKGRLRELPAYSMGLIMFHARLASLAPRLVNALTHTPGVSRLVKLAGGLSPAREMPPFAHQTFKDWFEERGAVNPGGTPVVLFPDTFNNFLHPETMKAGVEVLEAAGFDVIVPEQPLCCGRPLYDYGMLDTAKVFWRRMLDVLAPQIREGIPVVGIEPSCVAAFRDELPGLMPHDEDAKRLSLQTLTLAELLQRHAPDWEPPRLDAKALVHGHCHHEAVMGMSAESELYSRMGLDFEVLDSGCCGLAGSFGFERDHDEISREIGEQRLMPAVRGAGERTILIADGFSCKTQIEELTDRRALHTAQVLKLAMEREHTREKTIDARPEDAFPDVVLGGEGKLREAAVIGGAVFATGAAAGAAALLRSGARR
jgi:Fe-S oxidoreductase